MALTHRLFDRILVDFGRDLDFEFLMSNIQFALSQQKIGWLPRNEKQTYQLNIRPQMWQSILTLAMTMTLNFQGKIFSLIYISNKCPDCHILENRNIDCMLGLKNCHQFWTWLWPWPRSFKVKYLISYLRKEMVQMLQMLVSSGMLLDFL